MHIFKKKILSITFCHVTIIIKNCEKIYSFIPFNNIEIKFWQRPARHMRERERIEEIWESQRNLEVGPSLYAISKLGLLLPKVQNIQTLQIKSWILLLKLSFQD